MTFDRSRPPAAGPLRGFRFPPFEHRVLGNGLRLLIARQSRTPVVSVELLVPSGGQAQAPRPGFASLHGGLLDEGTAERTAVELATAVEGLGASLGSGAGWDVAHVSIDVLSRHLDAGLDLLAEVARGAVFPAAEVERLRRERLADLLRQRRQPRSLARHRLAREIYGDGIYGAPLHGTEESCRGIERAELVDFYRRQMRPAGSAIVAVGDLDPARFAARVEAVFGDWSGSAAALTEVTAPEPLAGRKVAIVDRPQAAQVQLSLGHVGVPRRHPDFPALVVLNAIYGGLFTSRINLSLRERHGFTYGAHSSFSGRRGPGPFVIGTAVATESTGTAVAELLAELERIRDEPVTDDELRDARDYLVGVFPYTLQTVGGVASRLEALALHELPLDYYEGYPALLAEIERDEVLAAARRHLDPQRLAIVAVGPAKELRPQLEGLGELEIHDP